MSEGTTSRRRLRALRRQFQGSYQLSDAGAVGDDDTDARVPRPIAAHELDELVSLVDENLGAGPLSVTGTTFRTSHARVYTPENLRNILAIREAGRLVAEVPYVPWRVRSSRGPTIFGLGFISPTATRASHRGKGYGRACLSAALAQMARDDECELSALNTLLTTFRFYEQAGFAAVQPDTFVYDLFPSDAPLFYDPPADGEVIWKLDGGRRYRLAEHRNDSPDLRGKNSELRRMHEIHDEEVNAAGGFLRTLAETTRIHGLPGVTTLLWSSKGSSGANKRESPRVQAYLLLGGKGPEAGGHPRGVRALLCHALSHWGELIRPGQAVSAPPIVVQGTTGDTATAVLAPRIAQQMESMLASAWPAYAYGRPTVLGTMLDDMLPGRRSPYNYRNGSGLMVRINQPRKFIEKLVTAGELPGEPRQTLSTAAVDTQSSFSIAVTDDADDPHPISFESSQVAAGASSCGRTQSRLGEQYWRVGTTKLPRHADISRIQLSALLLGSHTGRLHDTAGLPAWLHHGLMWRGLTVFRFDTS